jgi:hypothetical protein
LARSILSITGKIEKFLESRFVRAVREIGFALATKLACVAKKWGNKTAFSWSTDKDFARFLAVMKLNT